MDVIMMSSSAPAEPHAEEAGPFVPGQSVGIWKSEDINGQRRFVRESKNKIASLWASVPVIPPKSERKRVVLLGESVARGYLFDPHFNPALCLQQIVNKSNFIDAEIVDLARVSIEMPELTQLTRDCLALKPDVIVVFAGNNWFASYLNISSSNELAEINALINEHSKADVAGVRFLNNDVFNAIRQNVEDKLATLAAEYITLLSEIARANQIPVIVVIPEFNLLDWKSTEMERILFRLSAEDLDKWLNAKWQAEQAIERADNEALKAAANVMIATDGSHPLGYELLAQYYLNNNDNAGARLNLEKARDTSLFCRSSGQARIYKVIQNKIIATAAETNLAVINLVDFFDRHFEGQLPGRNIFLDYCHLNDAGIILTMKQVAKKLLTALNIKADENLIDELEIDVDSDVKAIAYLCAAVHNAHYGQGDEIIGYLVREANECSHISRDIFKKYADFSSRKIDTVLCKSHQDLIEGELITQYERGSGFISKRGKKLLDLSLVDAMIATLKDAAIDIGEEITDLRMSEHSPASGPVDLLTPFYNTTSYDTYFGKEKPYYVARGTTSDFCLLADSYNSLNLKITYRMPETLAAGQAVQVLVNGNPLRILAVTNSWHTVDFEVPASMLVKGVNSIKLIWPHHGIVGLTANVLSSQEQSIDKLTAIFGELHMFKAIQAPLK
ncbi:hypothetical protein INP83_12280 [Mucilaginibacter sp. 21P]|uniref:hypothetical protein n=1 Tax=Mucilaginibacter sp. 21P TaxID=2778902 RepID=UPI001C59C8C1|nr:hypothetical protein [Mucilaginibacter sp. 21P]QXV63881.1 hypothetical protein INP83_12280 [Mucilaginibacter sp. 21P]